MLDMSERLGKIADVAAGSLAWIDAAIRDLEASDKPDDYKAGYLVRWRKWWQEILEIGAGAYHRHNQ